MSNISFEQRVLVFRAASGLIDKAQITRAMEAWESSGNAAFDCLAFCKLCETTLMLDRSTASSLTQNLSALIGPAGFAPATPPASTPPSVNQAPVVATQSGQPEHVIFSNLVIQLVEQLDASAAERLKSLADHQFKQPKTSLDHKALLQALSSGSVRGEQDSWKAISEKQMKSLLDLMYTFFCEILGPVKTDRVFAQAVRTVEALPQASQFSPRRLL